jgi:hypothetical protein
MELVRGASAANNFVFLQWDTYGVARDRPTVAGEVVERLPHLTRQSLPPALLSSSLHDIANRVPAPARRGKRKA